jgi:transposase
MKKRFSDEQIISILREAEADVSDCLGVSAHSLYKWLRAIKPDNSEHLTSLQYQYIFNGYNM